VAGPTDVVGVPHSGQNFWPVASSVPQVRHAVATGVPHSAQNFAPGGSSAPQLAQAISALPRSRQDSNPLRAIPGDRQPTTRGRRLALRLVASLTATRPPDDSGTQHERSLQPALEA
jgi:hypothetical protein